MYKRLKIKMYNIFNQFCIGSDNSGSIFNLSFNLYDFPLILIIWEWCSNLSNIAFAKVVSQKTYFNLEKVDSLL